VRKISRWALLIALIGAAMMMAAPQPAEAASTRIGIRNISIDEVSCATGEISADIDLAVSVPVGESAEIWYSINAPGAASPVNSISAINLYYGGPPLVGPLEFVQVNWGVGNTLGPLAKNTLITIRYYDIYSGAASSFKVNCTTGELYEKEKGEKDEPYTGIILLPDAVVAPYFGVPNAAGALPCGVFDVNGWGTKYIGMADFPACTAPVEVLCLNGDREWTADNVSGVIYHDDYEVDFTSSQDGVCAFFSAQ
jgi:hypothetical protein